MTDRREPANHLERVLGLSRELASAADRGEGDRVVELDAERRQLLKSLRASGYVPDAVGRRMLEEIALLNDRAIGHLEHHRRIKARELDVIAVGRRAVSAYGSTCRRWA